MKFQITVLATLGLLAACNNDTTPAQEQRAEQLEDQADAVEQQGDERVEAIDDRTDAQAEALDERADAVRDGDVPATSAPQNSPGMTGTDSNRTGTPSTLPPATTGTPPSTAAGAGENG